MEICQNLLPISQVRLEILTLFILLFVLYVSHDELF